MTEFSIKFNRNDYSGEISSEYNYPEFIDFLCNLNKIINSDNVTVLQDGRNRNVRYNGKVANINCDFVIKSFGKDKPIKKIAATLRGDKLSKAKKSWNNACHLIKHEVHTPKPVAIVERYKDATLEESYFITTFESDTVTFTQQLGHLFRNDPNCEKFINLLQVTAENIKKMHDSGMQHRDLGNQNILMRKSGNNSWTNVMFIDLNRARVLKTLTLKQRAKDLSRIFLPSDLLRVFFEMYFGDEIPKEFTKAETKYRARYQLHHKSRKFRHPIREYKNAKKPEHNTEYPADRDLWVWDYKSVQPQNVWKSKEKHKLYPPLRTFKIIASTIRWLPSVYISFKKLTKIKYTETVTITDKIGMSISPKPATWEQEYSLLKELKYKMPLLIRVYAHESQQQQDFLRKIICSLGKDGFPIMLAFCQNREAVKDPDKWKSLINNTIEHTHKYIQRVEVGHTINRAKWGIWDYAEYGTMIKVVAPLKNKYPNIQWCGPAAIDFDYPDLLAALDETAEHWQFDALSHQLYVDRRGAPENTQIGQSTLEKIMWGKSISLAHPATSGKFIISEVNWPLRNTGVYSPIGSPYLRPNQVVGAPSVSEETYAVYMIRYYLIACCSGFVETVYWWQLVAHGFGLVDNIDCKHWRKRPAFDAYKFLLKIMQNAVFVEFTPANNSNDKGGIYKFQTDKIIKVVYTTLSTNMNITISPEDKAFDIYGNQINHNGKLKISESPVFIVS